MTLYYIGMVDTTAYTDEELVLMVQSGETQAFGELVVRYEDKMKRYARRFLFHTQDCEDAVQQVFIKAFENIQSFDIEKQFSPWLYRVAHNQFISILRKRKNEAIPFFDPDTLFPHPVAEEKTDDDILSRERHDEIEAALSQLKPKYREVVALYYFEGFEYEQIAEILRIPKSTVGVRLKRAKDSLKGIIENTN